MEFIPCVILETEITVRNQSQIEQWPRGEKKRSSMKERNNPRKNNPVEYPKNDKFHKSPITSKPIPETSQNIIFSSHKVTDMS